MDTSDSSPYSVLKDLRLAEAALRAQNCNFDANIMAAAYESIWSLLSYADAMAMSVIGWEARLAGHTTENAASSLGAAVDEYVSYRGSEAPADDKYIQDGPKYAGFLTRP